MRLWTLGLCLLTLGAAPSSVRDHGQGSADPSAVLSQLRPGKLLFGQALTSADLYGKIVVVEMGGS